MRQLAPQRTIRARAGFSLLETMVGIAVLMIGLLAMTSTSVVVHSLGESDKSRRLATNALRAVIEEVNALSYASTQSELGWAAVMTDAYGTDGQPGATFAVRGLDPWPGLAQVGSVWIVTDEQLTDRQLGAELGMPRDLDGDGLASSTDVSGSATVLPVVVRLRWTGEAGDRELIHGFYILGL
jgi:type II secretory pathway pseudopilin PulG